MKVPECAAIAQAMKSGGYLDAVLQAGPELNRVRTYLLAFANGDSLSQNPLQNPDYPCFPGLRSLAFHNAADFPAAASLERHFGDIYEEWAGLPDSAYLEYAPAAMTHTWTVHLLRYMGIDFEAVTRSLPKTRALLQRLPGACLDYPWGDALISVHARDAHLHTHCSVDSLRVRCHLGIQVPSGCEIRVGNERSTWQEGRALLFEDSFEHEVWNRGDRKRAILIVDFWHPDLTAVEIEALTAGFRKSEVRRQFARFRLQMARNAPAAYLTHLDEQIAIQDDDPVVRKYWRT